MRSSVFITYLLFLYLYWYSNNNSISTIILFIKSKYKGDNPVKKTRKGDSPLKCSGPDCANTDYFIARL